MTSNSDILAGLLDEEVSTSSKTAAAIKKDNYHKLVRLQNVSSFSMQSILHECPRKFQLLKLEADYGQDEREGNADFAFGHAVGAGVAVLDETGNLRQAIWAAFLAWNIDLFEESPVKPNRPNPNKSFWHAVWAIKVYEVFRAEETDLDEYETVQNEASIAVDFEDGHFYTGHIDELLKHKATGHLKVKENKTTAYATVDPLMYENSNQALSYSLVVDALGENEYAVMYTVYSSTEQRWMQFEFTKTALQKAHWLQDQFFTHADIDMYKEQNFFPKRGESCLNYNRRCQFYEQCGLNSDRVYGKRFDQLDTCNSIDDLRQIEKVDYAFTFSEIKARLQQNTQSTQSSSQLEEM